MIQHLNSAYLKALENEQNTTDGRDGDDTAGEEVEGEAQLSGLVPTGC